MNPPNTLSNINDKTSPIGVYISTNITLTRREKQDIKKPKGTREKIVAKSNRQRTVTEDEEGVE